MHAPSEIAGEPTDAPRNRLALALRARILARFAADASELALYGCRERPLADALGRSVGDSAEAAQARAAWPDLKGTAPSEWIKAAAALFRVAEAVIRMAASLGWIGFTDALGVPAVVLISDCRTRAEAWRLFGGQWLCSSGFSPVRLLPGSLKNVPIGSKSITPEAIAVAVVAPWASLLPMLAVLGGELAENGLIAFPSSRFSPCRELLADLAGRRARLFLPAEDRWTDAEAAWSGILEGVGCEVDCFDWTAFNVTAAEGFARIPHEERNFELLAA